MKVWWLAALSCFFGSAAVAESTWRIDSFSYFHVPAAGIIKQLQGGSIPLEIFPSGNGRWSVRLPKSRMGTSSFQSSDLQVTVATMEDGVGEFVLDGGTFRGSLTLKLQIAGTVKGKAISLPFAFSLTTQHSEIGAGAARAAIDGVPLDPASGQVQLVAVGSNPPGLGAISGQPYYVVLSGRLENLPADMRR